METENGQVIEWEDYEHELARLWSLSSALKDSEHRKLSLQHKLETLIQVKYHFVLMVDCHKLDDIIDVVSDLRPRFSGCKHGGQVKSESLSRINELDEMRNKLEDRKLAMGNSIIRLKVAAEDAKRQEQQLYTEVRSLLVDGTSLSSARKQLQEARRSLAGEKGYVLLKNTQTMLRTRQQHMFGQVSFLYPVKVLIDPALEQELESYPCNNRSGNSLGSRSLHHGTLTILGQELSMLPFKQMSFFTDKKEIQRSATSLGYISHAVVLIASYLQVPLRYPLQLGGSHSFVLDFAPSIDPTSSDLSSIPVLSSNVKPVEFPLFLHGQDTTRAAYAVFLLNKDLEQLLNLIGVNSLGPRQLLPNLKELLLTLLSSEYLNVQSDIPALTER